MDDGPVLLSTWQTFVLLALTAAPLQLLIALIQVIYFTHRGMLRSGRRARSVFAIVATYAVTLLLSPVILVLLPPTWIVRGYAYANPAVILVAALLAPLLTVWAARTDPGAAV